MNNLDKYITTENITVVQAMQKIDANVKGIVFVVDESKKLIGCVSDGDIRRWLIKTADLNAPLSKIMFKNPKYIFQTDNIDAIKYMTEYSITALPVLNETGVIVDIVFRDSDTTVRRKQGTDRLSTVPVVIMAGGKGTRLYPYTKILPKPLIPIGDIPILERIMNRFIECGAREFFLTVNYKKSMIKSYFEEANLACDIEYVEESKPLGTAGSLKLIDRSFDCPIFITNCDILIDANLEDIYNHHINSGNAITIVSSLKNITVPYGVLDVKEQGIISGMREKPSLSYFVNTGMYVVNPELLSWIPDDTFYHMPQLAEEAMARGYQVGMYPISEDAFLDMGEFAEMQRMEEKLKK